MACANVNTDQGGPRMGMYTEIFFRAEVDAEAYFVLEPLLRGCTHGDLPDHPVFAARRLGQLFNGCSAYFPGANHTETEVKSYGPAKTVRSVSFRANLKNYDGVIEKFFDWVLPHIDGSGGEFVGYSLYEEATTPTLYYAP